MPLTITPYAHNDPSLYSDKIQITPSEQQGRFFTFIKRETGSCLLVAAAGSGKTTTIVQATRLLPLSVSVQFTAFNKSIAAELEKKLPQTVSCGTFHSTWFRALQQ